MSTISHPHHHHHHLSKSTTAAAPAAVVSTTTSSTITTTTNTTTTQACAACKYARRKCAPDCILAPYFPHDRQRQFLNAHKLFGVSNITKIIKNLDPFEREEAMRTIIFQSDVRSLDPVGGCFRIIRDLQRQIEYSKAELEIVLRQLAMCKQQAAAAAAAAAILEADPMSGYGGIEHQFVEGYEGGEGFVVGENENGESLDEEVDVVWGIQDSSCSSLQLKQGGSIDDFDDIKIDTHNHHHHHHNHHHHQQQQHHFKFQHNDHDLVHHSEEAMLKMDNVMLKEDNDPIRQAQDQELKGAVDNLFTFPSCDP